MVSQHSMASTPAQLAKAEQGWHFSKVSGLCMLLINKSRYAMHDQDPVFR